MTDNDKPNIVRLNLRPGAKTQMAASDLQRQIERGRAMTINSAEWSRILQIHLRTAEEMQKFCCNMMIAQAQLMEHFFKQVEGVFGKLRP